MGRLREHGIELIMVADANDLNGVSRDEAPRLALLDVASLNGAAAEICLDLCSQLGLPIIALVPEDRLSGLDASLAVDDFLAVPAKPDEVLARARRVLSRRGLPDGSDLVRAGDLLINTATYDVSLGGTPVSLRFKEYELLLLMARSPGTVYTRETLLKRVWGYEYLGGSRTVDVHIRRLRSKIEDAEHSFIETIWNLGYRFRVGVRG